MRGDGYFVFQRNLTVPVSLDVYIYYDNVAITWSQGPVTANNGGALTYYVSTFDEVNYSALVGTKEKLTINMNIDRELYGGHGVTLDLENNLGSVLDSSFDYTASGNIAGHVYLSYIPAFFIESTMGSPFVKDVNYLTLLKVKYSYYNGFKEPTSFYRNILVYGATVIRR